MRDLWPDTSDRLQQIQADKEREYNDLVDRINAVAEDCAENHRVDTAEIAAIKDTLNNMQSYISTETINAMLGRINDIEASTIDTNNIEADRATIDAASIATGTVDNLKATNAELTETTINKATIQEADITKATITDLNFQNLEADNFKATDADITNADIGTATVENITVDDKANVGDLTAVKGDIGDLTSDTAEIREIQNNKIETEFILHNTESIAITEPNRIIVELPYFVNGVYKILLLDGSNNTYLSLEAFNSASNFVVKWNNGAYEGFMPLQRIVFYNNNSTTSQAYLEIMTNGKALTMFYQCDSYATVTPPQVYTDWPIDTSSRDAKIYDVSGYIAATLFNRPTISATGSSDVSTLTLTNTELYNTRTIEPTVYDTTINKVRVTYTPDQNVNSTEPVKFLSVEAPFLNVADLDVADYFKAPNIYNGIELSAAEIEDLPDETLYIPRTGGTTGEIHSGIAIYDIPTLPATPDDIPVLGDEIRYYSSSLVKAFAGQTFIMDEYKPQDGYSLTLNSAYPNTGILPNEVNYMAGYQNTLVKNDKTNELYIMKPGYSQTQQRWGIAKLSNIGTNGQAIGSRIIESGSTNHGVVTNEMADEVPDWAIWNPEDPLGEYYVFGNLPNYNERFYIDVTPDAAYVPTGYYTVIYPNIGLKCLGSMTYTKVGNEGRLYRKKTFNNTVSVLPLIPYREVEA